MDGNLDKEYIPPSTYQKFAVNVYNVTFNILINSMEIRYFSKSIFPTDSVFYNLANFTKIF
jgi:hypothetical protein